MNEINALLLAAGNSSRLWPVENKLFLNFLGIPLIQHSLNSLKRSGIKKFIIIAGKNNVLECQKLADFNSDVSVKILVQNNNFGMAGAVLTAESLIQNKKILIVGPSDLTEEYLISDFKTMLKSSPDGIMVGKTLSDYESLGFYTVHKNIVTDIKEKPGSENLTSNIAAIVFDYYKNGSDLIAAIKKSSSYNDDLYEKAKNILIQQGYLIKLLHYNGYWGFLKYPWHVLGLTSYFLSKIKSKVKKAQIHESVNMKGKVYIEDNVTILENVRIVGPVYIGSGTTIGQNCLIRESLIDSNSVIGFASEITRSYIGANCWFHHNYIGDSVILNNSAFGSGAVIANYRLDGLSVKSVINNKKIDSNRTKLGVIVGKNCRIGVNASIMPGIKIGNHTYIGSGIVVDKDIPNDKFLKFRQNNTEIISNLAKHNEGNIEKNLTKLKF